jgi:hypothetical protein
MRPRCMGNPAPSRSRALRRIALVAAVLWLGALPLAASAGESGTSDTGEALDFERQRGPLSDPAEALDRGGRKPFDVVFQRPLELLLLGVGAVAFVPAYPVAWLFGGGDEVLELCITDPYARVFDTPLGEL